MTTVKADSNTIITRAIPAIKSAQHLLINYAYHCGMIAAFSDKTTGKIHLVKSKLKLSMYWSVQIFLLIHKSLITIYFMKDLMDDNIYLTSVYDLMNTQYLAFFIFTGLLNFHTIWKTKSLVRLTNVFNKVFEDCEEKYVAAGGPPLRNHYGKIIKGFFWTLFPMHLLMLSAYWLSCELHYHSRVFHICNCGDRIMKNGIVQFRHKCQHEPFPKFILFSILQLFGFVEEFASACVYIAFGVPGILVTLEVFTKLRDTSPGSYFERHDNWVKQYKIFQLLVSEVNECMRTVLLPMFTSGSMIIIVLVNYIIIRGELNPATQISLAICNIVLLALFLIIILKGSEVSIRSGQALALRKRIPNQSKISKLELKSLYKIHVGVGTMRYLDEESRLIALMALFDYTSDALLTL